MADLAPHQSASPSYGIALHSSTPQLGIAVNNFAGDCRSQVWDLGRGLAAQLHQRLQEILMPQTWQDFKFIAVAKGPGGFTGTRVGVVTARTIAQQLELPLYGISNLLAVAAAHHQQNQRSYQYYAVQMDARREQLFVGIYQITPHGWQTYLEDTLMNQKEWEQTLGEQDFPYKLLTADHEIAPTVTQILQLAHQLWQQKQYPHWSEVTPYYGQHPVTN